MKNNYNDGRPRCKKCRSTNLDVIKTVEHARKYICQDCREEFLLDHPDDSSIITFGK